MAAFLSGMIGPKRWQRLTPPAEGQARRFVFEVAEREEQGFLVRHRNGYFAYRNRCPHAGTSLDWTPGLFFSVDHRYLVCQTHGAHFDPASGAVRFGPGPHGLDRLPVRTADGFVEVPASYSEPPWG